MLQPTGCPRAGRVLLPVDQGREGMPLPDVLGSITPVKSPRMFLTGGLVPGAEIPPVGVPFPGSWGESMGDCAGMRVMSVGDAAALGAMRQRIFLSLTSQKTCISSQICWDSWPILSSTSTADVSIVRCTSCAFLNLRTVAV